MLLRAASLGSRGPVLAHLDGELGGGTAGTLDITLEAGRPGSHTAAG